MNKLRQNIAYQGINIDAEMGHFDVWLHTPKGAGKKRTPERIFRWMNQCCGRAARSETRRNTLTSRCCAEKVLRDKDQTYTTCGRPIPAEQRFPGRPFCPEHLAERLRLDATRANGHAS